MIESPVLKEIIEEQTAKSLQSLVLEFLTERFGEIPPEIVVLLKGVTDDRRLHDLARWSARCISLEELKDRLSQ